MAVWALVVAALVVALAARPADSAARPAISVSPQDVAPGASVTTTGSGFPSRAKGSISFDGGVLATFTASRRGKFSKQWTVPSGARTGTVVAKTATREASATLRVQPPPPEGAERWSDPATWGEGGLPTGGETVTIPHGKTVLLDRSTPPLGGLQVDGTLLFEDADHTLTSDWIMVHGRLQVGTEAEPIRTRARISLTGVNRDQNVMNMGTKSLGMMGGALEVHGESRPS